MNMIVMQDTNGCIGINGDQPVHLHYDLDRFKELTLGKTVVCGRKTVKTFPNGVPLKNRYSIVVSTTLSPVEYLTLHDRNAITVSDPFTVVKLLKNMNPSDVYVIGGASIYEALLPWTTRVFVTLVHTEFCNRSQQPGLIYPDEHPKYFPTNILHEQFQPFRIKNILDYDESTKKEYNTTFTEYVRL